MGKWASDRAKYGQELFKYVSGLAGLLILIEFCSRISVLPGIATTLSGLRSLWSEGTLQHNVLVSVARWMVGWSIGSLIGVSLGFLTGRVRAIRYSLEGLLVVLRAVPFICLVPISLLIFGLSEKGKFFLVGWASAAVCWVVVHETAFRLEPHLKWRANALGLGQFRWIKAVLIPSCAGGVFAGLRTSLSMGLIVVAVAEMSGVYEASSGLWWSEGLGYRMFKSLDEARNDLLLASILVFALLGVTGDLLLRLVWAGALRLDLAARRHRAEEALRQNREEDGSYHFHANRPVEARLTGLSAGYGSATIIRDLSMAVPAGQTLSVIGPSGCGKTTLLRAIGRFMGDSFWLSKGVFVDGNQLSSSAATVGLVLQEAPVFGHLTVLENVTLSKGIREQGMKHANMTGVGLLKEFGIETLAPELAREVSGGQRQRLALAMAIASRPALLLLDEPFGALDAITRRRLQQFFEVNLHGKVTCIFVTHDVEEALLVGDIVRVGVEGTGNEIYVDKGDCRVHEWERTPDFVALRAKLLDMLDDSAQ